MNHAWASRQTSKWKGESELATRSMSSTSETTISYVIYIHENQAMSSTSETTIGYVIYIRENQAMLSTSEREKQQQEAMPYIYMKTRLYHLQVKQQ